MAPTPLRLRPLRPWVLFLEVFNIRDVRGIGLAHAFQEVHIVGFDLMILTDTNTTYQAYLCNRLVYDVVCSPSIMTASGGASWGDGHGHQGLITGMEHRVHAFL